LKFQHAAVDQRAQPHERSDSRFRLALLHARDFDDPEVTPPLTARMEACFGIDWIVVRRNAVV